MTHHGLASLFAAHTGKGVDKWEQYFWIYDAELAPLLARGTPLSLLEIGVQNGGSLELWAKYLPQGSRIVGLDIDPRVGELRFGGQVTAHVADVNDTARLTAVLGDATFDVIVDDGSHHSKDVKSAFRNLFDRVRPGGLFVVEDMHAAYWASHGGGLRARESAVEFFKGLADGLSIDHFQSVAGLSTEELAELVTLAPWLGRVSFYDSVIVVQKLKAPRTEPYRRVLSGTRFDVVDPFAGIDLGLPAGGDGEAIRRDAVARLIFELKTRAGLAVPEPVAPLPGVDPEAVERELRHLAGEDRESAARGSGGGLMARLMRLVSAH